MNIIIFGPQGSGKGTQAKKVVKKHDLIYLDLGKLLREKAKEDPLIDEYVNKKGEFLPEDISSPIALEYLDKKAPDHDGIVFDGFPRSQKQLDYLDEWLEKKDQEIDLAIMLDISDKEAVKRLSNRRVCSKCGEKYNLITNPPPDNNKCKCGGKLVQRQDDKPSAIKKRLSWYKELNEPLIKVYKERGILEKIDGERPIDVIFKDIVSRIEKIK